MNHFALPRNREIWPKNRDKFLPSKDINKFSWFLSGCSRCLRLDSTFEFWRSHYKFIKEVSRQYLQPASSPAHQTTRAIKYLSQHTVRDLLTVQELSNLHVQALRYQRGSFDHSTAHAATLIHTHSTEDTPPQVDEKFNIPVVQFTVVRW